LELAVTWLWLVAAFLVGAWTGVIIMAALAANSHADDLAQLQAALWRDAPDAPDEIPW
jgi:hypothetical protein